MRNNQFTFPPCPFEKRHPSALQQNDDYYMQLAYNQAIDAWNSDETPIGAIIVHENKIIARAHNQVDSAKDPTAHAEILAITQAAAALGDWRLNGATLYVTKEPCPMCSGAVIMSRLSRVVFAVSDPKMGCLGGTQDINSIPTLNHHTAVSRGVMEEECLALIQSYFALKRVKKESAPVDE